MKQVHARLRLRRGLAGVFVVLAVACQKDPAAGPRPVVTGSDPPAEADPFDSSDERWGSLWGARNQIAGQVFWKPLRDRARRLESEADAYRYALDEPRASKIIEAELRRALNDTTEETAVYVRESVEVGVADAGAWMATRTVLEELVPTGGATRIFRNLLAHPASPVGRFDFSRLVSATTGSAESGIALYSAGAPDFAELETAAEAGVSVWLAYDSVEGRTMAEQQFAHIAEVGRRDGRPLPIPLIFLCAANRMHLENLDGVSGRGSVKTRSAVAEGERATVVWARVRGADRSKALVVTAGAGAGPHRALGSRALSISVAIEAVRVLVTNAARQSVVRPRCDIVFAFGVDPGVAFEWLDRTRQNGQRVIGVLNVGLPAAASRDHADLVVSLGGCGPESSVASQAHRMANDLRGREGAWRRAWIDIHGPSVEAATARRIAEGHTVPVVTIAACGTEPGAEADGGDFPPLAGGPLPDPHRDLGTAGDRIDRITTARVEGQVTLARYLLMLLVQLSASGDE